MIDGRLPSAMALTLVILFTPVFSAASGFHGEIKVSSDVRPVDLIVYVANPPPGWERKQLPAATMDQRNQSFFPHVLAIVKGAAVKFQNSDRVAHNVFSFSPTKTFDLGKIAPSDHKQLIFDKPGIVEVLCGFHSRMVAYIRVMDHPYFAVPDEQGKFVIKGLPPGNYQLRIWHESAGEQSKEIALTRERSDLIQIKFPR